MELRNVPGRAYRKWQSDGLAALAREGREFLLTELLFRRLGYNRILRNRVSIVDRDALRRRPGTRRYDAFDGPIRYKGSPPRGHGTPTTYEPGDRFVAEVPNATLLGPVGPGLTADGRIVTDTVSYSSLAHRRAGIGVARSMAANGVRRTVRALDGDAIPDRTVGTVALAVPPWNNYYHWTAECLPRVRLLERYADDTGEYPTLLVPADRPSWMTESLTIADYPGSVAGLSEGITRADRLVVPTFPDPTPIECAWLRDRMREGAGVPRDERCSRERIYVARGDATVRRITNRDAVQRVFDEFDIDTYLLSDLSVREQIDLFSRAELVVGPHGAGLTNVVFGDDLDVVELFGSDLVATFDRLAEFMGHDYTALQCRQAGLDIRVDCDRLSAAIEEMLDA